MLKASFNMAIRDRIISCSAAGNMVHYSKEEEEQEEEEGEERYLYFFIVKAKPTMPGKNKTSGEE